MRAVDDTNDIEIADLDEALTFARIGSANGPRAIVVTRWKGGEVEGVDLSIATGEEVADPVSFFVATGYDAIREIVRGAAPYARVETAESSLVLPVDFTDRHIAVGTNYPEHASESGTTRPFLFPKLVQPGLSGDAVSIRGGLLDYEVEIAAVPLETVTAQTPPRFLGLMLANDFTDRETLMHAVDRRDIESGKGFTTGKSFPGYLPVGALFVVPRDYRCFVSGIELRLRVNGGLRQQAPASDMVWNIDEVFAQSLARKGVHWEHRGQQVPLFDGDGIAARTLLLTGTPRGTAFCGVPPRVMVAGLLRWLAGGWARSLPTRVIESYCATSREAGTYLQPGDEVRIDVPRLGKIVSSVVA